MNIEHTATKISPKDISATINKVIEKLLGSFIKDIDVFLNDPVWVCNNASFDDNSQVGLLLPLNSDSGDQRPIYILTIAEHLKSHYEKLGFKVIIAADFRSVLLKFDLLK